MPRYIDAEKIKFDKSKVLSGDDVLLPLLAVERAIRTTPTEDAVKVVHGKWIFETLSDHDVMTCSNCRTVHEYQDGTFSYCPYCGAKMDGERAEASD